MTVDETGESSADIRYLSPEWFTQADDAVSDLPATLAPVSIAVRVLTADDAAIHYRLILGPDRVRLLEGEGPGEVRMTMSYRTASAIAKGDLGAQRAFLDGDVQLGGETTALLGHQEQLAKIDDRLGPLRAKTQF